IRDPLVTGVQTCALPILSRDLTIRDRVVRRLLCARMAPAAGWAANVDLARWRQQMNAGLLAARRIEAAERSRPFDLVHFHTQARSEDGRVGEEGTYGCWL